MKYLINKWYVGLLLFFYSSFAMGQNVSFDVNVACTNSTSCSPFLNDYACGTQVTLRTTHGSPQFYSLTRNNTTKRVIEFRASITQDQANNTINYSEGLTFKYSFKTGTQYTIKIKHIGIPSTTNPSYPQLLAAFAPNPPRRNEGCGLGMSPLYSGGIDHAESITVSSNETTTSFVFQPTKDYSFLWLFSNPLQSSEVGSLVYSIEIVDGSIPGGPTCYTDANFNFCDPAKIWNGSADVRAVNPLNVGCDAFKTSSAPGAGVAFVRRFTAPSITLSPGFVGSATDPSGAVRTLKIIPSSAPCTQQLRVASPISNIKNETEPEKPLMENIQIYPSPSKGLVNINFNRSALLNAEITVADQSGRIVYQMRNQSESNLVQLNLQHLSNGLYFIKVNAQNKVAVKKLLISK